MNSRRALPANVHETGEFRVQNEKCIILPNLRPELTGRRIWMNNANEHAGCRGKRARYDQRTPGDHSHNLTNAGAELQVMHWSLDALYCPVKMANTLLRALLRCYCSS